ncbi:unnamed protein product [Orchesella dallaii]|uniref:Odorant receptor n=1 Tax=Orchesella dallaii TaxID=48710 RepID=A0ABP1QCG9_9HEXA
MHNFSRKMATPLVWKAFQLHERLFSYMYHCPIYMDNKTRQLTKSSSFSKNRFFYFVFIICFYTICLNLAIFAIITETFYTPGGKNPSPFKISIMLTILIGDIFTIGILVIHLTDVNYVPAYNQLLQLDASMKTKFSGIVNQLKMEGGWMAKYDLNGIIVNVMVIVLAICPPFVLLFALVFKLDQVSYTVELFLPENEENRKLVQHIILPFLFRLVVCGLVVWEGCRQLSLDLILLSTFVKTVTHCLQIISRIQNKHQAYLTYRHLLLTCNANETASKITFLALSSGQVACVTLFCITVTYFKLSPSPILLIFPVFGVMSLLLMLVTLPPAIAMYETSNDILSNWKLGVFSREKQENSIVLNLDRSLRRDAVALRHVKMSVGPVMVMKRGYEREYLSVLLDNCMSALLLF